MANPVGLSFLFPAVPIACIFSMVALLILVPGFWRTRVLALNALVGWFFLGNLLTVIGMIQWRGNIKNTEIWADLLAGLGYIQVFGAYASIACFSKFVWQRSRPSAYQFLDNRRKINRIDAFITLILPVLWLPTFLISCSSRYFITEDIGPSFSIWNDWTGFVITILPGCVFAAIIATFNVLALLNYIRIKRGGLNSDPSQRSASMRNRKLIWFSFVNMILSLFIIAWTVGMFLCVNPISTWNGPGKVNTITQNIPYLRVVRYVSRLYLDAYGHSTVVAATAHSIFAPFLGFYLFAWFGFGAEARNSYREAFLQLLRLRSFNLEPKLGEPPQFGWKRSVIYQRSEEVYTTRPNVPVACRNSMVYAIPLPSELPLVHRPNSSGRVVAGRIEEMIQPYRPIRALSYHKPPFSRGPKAVTTSNAAVSTLPVASCIWCHKTFPSISPRGASIAEESAVANPGSPTSSSPKSFLYEGWMMPTEYHEADRIRNLPPSAATHPYMSCRSPYDPTHII